jgi:hypothetical protein
MSHLWYICVHILSPISLPHIAMWAMLESKHCASVEIDIARVFVSDLWLILHELDPKCHQPANNGVYDKLFWSLLFGRFHRHNDVVGPRQ